MQTKFSDIFPQKQYWQHQNISDVTMCDKRSEIIWFVSLMWIKTYCLHYHQQLCVCNIKKCSGKSLRKENTIYCYIHHCKWNKYCRIFMWNGWRLLWAYICYVWYACVFPFIAGMQMASSYLAYFFNLYNDVPMRFIRLV